MTHDFKAAYESMAEYYLDDRFSAAQLEALRIMTEVQEGRLAVVPVHYVLKEKDVNDLIDPISTTQLVAMLKDPPDNVKWTGDFGLFQRAAWRIEELDGLFTPRFIVPRARYNERVHEAVNEAVSAFMKHPHTIRYKNRWLRPEEYNLSIGACGVLIQAYLDFFTAVQDGEEKPLTENTIYAPDHIPDTTKMVCPRCGGPADNGHDRCLPPNPYNCTKCKGKEGAG